VRKFALGIAAFGVGRWNKFSEWRTIVDFSKGSKTEVIQERTTLVKCDFSNSKLREKQFYIENLKGK